MTAPSDRVAVPLRWLDGGPLDAARNMAIDEVLLEGAAERPTVRTYGWAPPAVSLGRFQEPGDLPAELAGFPVVRRMSGGGAILHRDELTYAVAVPLALLPPGSRGLLESYALLHGAVAAALADLGVDLDPGGPASSPAAAPGPDGEAFLCYRRRSSFDLTVGGSKLVGSAQRRGRGGLLLQHGSVPLGPAVNAPASTTLAAVLGAPPDPARLARRLASRLAAAIGGDLRSAGLTGDERHRAAELARGRYRLVGQGLGRVESAATIEGVTSTPGQDGPTRR